MKSSCSSAIDTVNYTIVKIQTMQGLSHEFKFPRKAVMSINTDLTSVFFKKFFKKGYEHGFYRLGHEDAYFEPYLDEDLDADRLKVKSQQAFLKPLLRKIKLDLEPICRLRCLAKNCEHNMCYSVPPYCNLKTIELDEYGQCTRNTDLKQ